MKEWHKAAIAGTLAVVITAVLVLGALMAFSPGTLSLGTNPTPTPTTPPVTASQMAVKITDSGYNSLDTSTTYTDSTNYQITYYHILNGQYVNLGSGSSGDVTVTVLAQDGGTIYAAISPRSGQNLYVDAPKTVANNPVITGNAQYFDISNTGVKQFVFKVSVANTPTDTSNIHLLWLYPYFIPQGTLSISSPADQTSIGTGTTTEYIKWTGTFAAAKTGTAITKVEVAFNTTDDTKITLSNVNIPGVGYLSGSQFTSDKGTASTTYTWKVNPYDLSAAQYMSLATGQDNDFSFNTQVSSTFASSDVISATISIYTLSPAGAPVAAITDTVLLEE